MFDPISATIGIGSIVGGGLGLIGAGQQASASEKAAALQSQAAKEAAYIQNRQYQQLRGDLEPWRREGAAAMGQLSDLVSSGQLQTSFDPRAQFQKLSGAYGIDPYDVYSQVTRPSELPGVGEVYEGLSQPFDIEMEQDPSYQWRLKQGQKALEASAAAKGGYFSGETGQALQEYGQGMASQEYQRAFERDLMQKQFGLGAYTGMQGADLARRAFMGQQAQSTLAQDMAQRQLESSLYGQSFDIDQSQRQNIYNMLSGLSGMGQSAAAQTGQAGMQLGGRLGDLTTGAAAAQAAGQLGQAQAWQGGLQNLGSQLQSGLGSMLQYDMMKKLMPQQTYGPAF